MSDNDTRELKEQLGEIQKGLTKLGNQVSAMQSTVDLLVQGRIKTCKDSSQEEAKSQDPMAKVTMAALEIIRMVVAALTGYLAGRGGGN
ncbi:MAG: hypothetical protein ACOWWO_11930 [Peptococcaceae bacterium]